MLAEAAAGAHRTVQILEQRGAGRDHPERAGVPETAYLKCWVIRAI
jgi:23S rRNA (cytosine1962-C5)-methyltransferase